jgi:hypothetical protein
MTEDEFKPSNFTPMDLIHVMITNHEIALKVTGLVNSLIDLDRKFKQDSLNLGSGTSGTITISKEDLKPMKDYELTFTVGCKD